MSAGVAFLVFIGVALALLVAILLVGRWGLRRRRR